MNVGLLDGHTITNRVADPCAWRDDELIGPEVDDEVLRNVVADRVEQLGRDQLHRRRQLRIRRRIELDQVGVAARIANRELGRDAGVWPAGDEPLAWRRTINLIRATEHVVHRHVVLADAIGKPAGIRHFAERVHVERGPEGACSLAKGVGNELVALGEIVFRWLGNRTHVVVAPQWIVRIEPHRSATRQRLCRWVRHDGRGEGRKQNDGERI